MSERLVVIGAVAAGAKAASRAKRLNPALDVLMLTREKDISYAGCGLPYYVGGLIRERKELVIRTPEEFEEAQGIRVLTEHEALAVDAAGRTVRVKNLRTGVESDLPYDRLVIATGASPSMPRLPGYDLAGVIQLHNVPAAEELRRLADSGITKAVVVGAGLIGVETAENLMHKGIAVTMLEREDLILSMFDPEVSLWMEAYLREKGLDIRTGQGVKSIMGESRVSGVSTEAGDIPGDVVIWATGVRPNSQLAKEAGAGIGPRGGIDVDSEMRTTLPDVWAAGDCTETIMMHTGDPAWVAMGSVANKTGRVAGSNVAGVGLHETFAGVAGTLIMKAFDATMGKTGLTEKEAVSKGYGVVTCLVPANDKAHYYPGHRTVFIKLVVDRGNRRILGAQVWGEGVVDKPLDVIATALGLGATVDALAGLDLAYAPPFSMAVGAVLLAANVIGNKLQGILEGISSPALQALLRDGTVTVLDVRTEPEHFIRAIPGSINIPLEELAERHGEIPRDKPVVAVCKVGRRAYLAALALKGLGYGKAMILDGGMEAYPYFTE